MTPFQYSRASDVADAISQIAADPAAKFIAGGTNLIDLMKYDVEHPARLIDISQLPLKNVGPRLPPFDRTALSDACECDPGRRVAAAAQHGIDRR